MRILYLHQYFTVLSGSGGTRSYEFARRLIANGHQVTMLTSAALLPEPYQSLKKVTRTELSGIPVIIIPVRYSNKMSFARRILAFVSFAVLASWYALRQPTDVIFATSTPLTIAIPGMLCRWLRRKPMVFEVRDLWPELPVAMGALSNPVARFVAQMLEWMAYHSSRHIIALSPGMAEGIQKRKIAGRRVTVIPNSSDVELFDVPAERGQAIRQKLGLTHDQPLVVYTGTFGHINGTDYLVRLANHARKLDSDIHFLMVGDGVDRAKIYELADELGVRGVNLTLREPMPKTELVNVLAAATVVTSLFINLPPMWNNSANKFFDALAAGKPIAINYRGWQAAILQESGAGIVLPPEDIELAAQQVVEFARDSTRLAQAREASRKLAYERFNRDLLFEKFEAVLREAI
ncbi:MAG: glycosyltransferase family 4 protein [Chloroflexi bacterium]|nr:glycosyltransferase family 4 protein [Chloroflexota bacterium]